MAPQDYTRRSFQAAAALIAVLICVAFIPPQTICGIPLRRANILSDILSFEDAATEAFLLVEDLRAVLEAEKAPPVLLPLYFRLRLAGALGFAPNLGQCGRCGRTISEDALFVVDEGQLRCSSCRSSRFELERYGVEIPAQGLDLLRHVQQSFPSGWPDGELPPPVRRACARAIDGFVQYHLGLAWEGNYFRRV